MKTIRDIIIVKKIVKVVKNYINATSLLEKVMIRTNVNALKTEAYKLMLKKKIHEEVYTNMFCPKNIKNEEDLLDYWVNKLTE